MSINYGGVEFSQPIPLSSWEPPFKGGLYAIVVPDQTSKPKPFRVVYFGQSSNMSERGFSSHYKGNFWLRQAGSEANLYIATYLMPNSSERDRVALEDRLVGEYRPACND